MVEHLGLNEPNLMFIQAQKNALRHVILNKSKIFVLMSKIKMENFIYVFYLS